LPSGPTGIKLTRFAASKGEHTVPLVGAVCLACEPGDRPGRGLGSVLAGTPTGMAFILENQHTRAESRPDQRRGPGSPLPEEAGSPDDIVIVEPPTVNLAADPTDEVNPSAAREITDRIASRLRRWNLTAGTVHLASAVAFLVVMTDFELPITASYATQDPALLEGTPPTEIIFSPMMGWGAAAFALLSALFHFLVAGPAKRTYVRGLGVGQNPFRWIEYSLSSTLMILLISMLLGIYDVAALIGLAGANVAMILFGWVMERQNTPGRSVDWYPFVFGSIVGLVPWIAIAVYLQGAIGNADEAVPAWVWGILFSIFALFNCFAVNQWLQYRAAGRWSSYVFGEATYIGLSLIAKTALVWQIYFGTVR
jgi:hypothetical protein